MLRFSRIKLLARSFATSSIRYANKNTVTLKKPKLDFKNIVENVELYKQVVQRREILQDPLISPENLSKLPELYQRLIQNNNMRKALVEQRTGLQEQTSKKAQPSPEIASQLKSIKQEIKQYDSAIDDTERDLYAICDNLPNLIDSSVHNTNIQVVEYLNFPKIDALPATLDAKTQYLRESLKPRPKLDHKTIGEKLNIFEFNQAAKVSGNSWYYLLNDGALLEQALVQYALKQARKAGFKMCVPPSIVKDEISQACGFKPRDQNNEQQTYEIKDGSLVLTGTAEISLAGLGLNTLYKHTELPRRLVGVSRSYRAEAGARGKSTKGLYRVHEFTKVELFAWCDQQSSRAEFEKIVNFQKSFVESLGLLARVINIPANDLGAPAYQKYDIETWMPGRGTWGEVTSASICTDYQARRFDTKYVAKDNTRQFVHTLNGTAVAVPRVIVALVENHYDAANNCIWIPEVLRPYMDDKEKIEL